MFEQVLDVPCVHRFAQVISTHFFFFGEFKFLAFHALTLTGLL